MNLTPLYQNFNQPNEPSKDNDSHRGLWFDKFFNHYEEKQRVWSIPKPDTENKTKVKNVKQDWINQVTGKVGDENQLKQFIRRQAALLRALKGQQQRYTTDWHFVTGMGNPHPVENGFSWHPTLAVPYLTGAAVKGLVRAWVESPDSGLSDEQRTTRLKSWFGSASKDQKPEENQAAGQFMFFDALPDQPPVLLCDIMTPHYSDWFSKKENAVPADWHDPIPIPFLAVKEAKFIFAIAPRTSALAGELNEVFSALNNALTWLGAGAKTATGYGYMTNDQMFNQEQAKKAKVYQEQQSLASLSIELQQVALLRKKLLEKQGSKACDEKMGGTLYQAMKQQIEAAVNWSAADKQALKILCNEIVVFIVAQKNSTAKQLLKKLDENQL